MNLHDLLTLTRVPSVGPQRLIALVNHFKDPHLVITASAKELIRVEGIEKKLALTIVNFFRDCGADQVKGWVEKQLSLANKVNARAVTFWDKEYPESLRKIYDPPPLLFVRGSIERDDKYSVAIVGTRSASDYGNHWAQRFGSELAKRGITTVSGLAHGIDGVAHAATLKAGGRTIAVLGSGVDNIYPPQNLSLAQRIMERGAVISEFNMGDAPDMGNFPRRNRIISGIALGTLVIESRPEGGSMITASLALEQNREVFAIPSALTDKRKSGTNLLIKHNKATLVESAEDIIEALASQLKPILKTAEGKSKAPPVQLTVFEQKLFDAMPDALIHIDALAQRVGFSTSDVLVNLLSLELKGVVRTRPGKMFEKV
jgi:DNA processing protein